MYSTKMYVEDFLNRAASAYEECNEPKMLDLFVFNGRTGLRAPTRGYDPSGLMAELPNVSNESIQSMCEQLFSESYAYADFVSAYLQLLKNSRDRDGDGAYELYKIMFSNFTNVFNGAETQWMVHLAKYLATQLVNAAYRADKSRQFLVKKPKSDNATYLLSRLLNTAVSDRSPMPHSKRLVACHLVSLSLQCFFRLAGMTRQIVRMMMNSLQSTRLSGADFPLADRVTFRYWLGRFHLLQNQLPKAKRDLEYAFRYCPVHEEKNRRVILGYLVIPCILLGSLPRRDILVRYGLGIYWDICQAMRKGSMQAFKRQLAVHESWLRSRLALRMFEMRGEILVYRSLVRRIWLLHGRKHEPTPIPFPVLKTAFLLSTGDPAFSDEDVVCLLSSLIDQGFVRGFLDFAQKALVLSGKNPFPAVAEAEPPEFGARMAGYEGDLGSGSDRNVNPGGAKARKGRIAEVANEAMLDSDMEAGRDVDMGETEGEEGEVAYERGTESDTAWSAFA
ncbi:uncharacterized protein VTP21DRAFT_6357 [Calcarisporiella thermophila]|uniref:uncharacterized protein n=1 Tax=Calcarisporiella thermophila TaxID=911321 RepID=UPI00374342BC